MTEEILEATATMKAGERLSWELETTPSEEQLSLFSYKVWQKRPHDGTKVMFVANDTKLTAICHAQK